MTNCSWFGTEGVYFDVALRLIHAPDSILPMLMYRPEVWGFHQMSDTERVYLKCLKLILGVKDKLRMLLCMVKSVNCYKKYQDKYVW